MSTGAYISNGDKDIIVRGYN